MLSEIFRNINDAYVNFRGDGKILVLFLVALLFLCVINSKPERLILTPLAAIGVAFSKAIDFAKTKWEKLLVILLIVYAISLSGGLIYSQNHSEKSENLYHIPGDYVEVMNYVLDMDSNPSCLAMPDYSIYHEMYSSRFDMLYSNRAGDDIRYLPENARIAYSELSETVPNMKAVADAAKSSDIEYVILKKETYWPEFPISKFGYELVKEFDSWEIYARKESGDEK